MKVLTWLEKRRWGLAVGGAMTLVGIALWAWGVLQPLNDAGLDFHLSHFGSIPADPGIVLIDIDDNAEEQVHAWPWPRRYVAELVDVLHELGAAEIVVDVAFVDHRAPRWEGSPLDIHYDLDAALPTIGGPPSEPIYDDAELAAALSRAGNVHLAMYCDLAPPEVPVREVIRGTLEAEVQRLRAGGSPVAGSLVEHDAAAAEVTRRSTFDLSAIAIPWHRFRQSWHSPRCGSIWLPGSCWNTG
jgi:hypothetical protein